jgi:hypothetical protein
MLRQKELEKATTIKGPEMAAAVNGLLKKVRKETIIKCKLLLTLALVSFEDYEGLQGRIVV